MDKKIKKSLARVITIIVFLITLILLWQSIHISALNPLSEDAIIDANKINISASVPGRIAAVYVTNTPWLWVLRRSVKSKKAIYCLHLIPQCTHSG